MEIVLSRGGCRRKLQKQKNPALLRMLLGGATNVVTLQRSQGIRLKEDYHAFRCQQSATLRDAIMW